MVEIVKGWKNEPGTLQWLKELAECKDSFAGGAASLAIAHGWAGDSEVLVWMKDAIELDRLSHDVLGDTSLRALAYGWSSDNSLFDFWCDRTLQAPFERVFDFQDNPRQIALEVLVKQYPTHPKTAELLQDRSQNDNDEQFRTWAQKQLTLLT